jgi:LytS/YehU family sensor histidine kinase
LLRAHLAIVALRSDGAIATTSRFDQSLGRAAFPPMVLVPMVAPFTSRDAAAGDVNVDGVAVDNRIRVTVVLRGPIARPMADAAPLAEVRERVHAIYRNDASLAIDRSYEGATSIILDIPNEPADRDHR